MLINNNVVIYIRYLKSLIKNPFPLISNVIIKYFLTFLIIFFYNPLIIKILLV